MQAVELRGKFVRVIKDGEVVSKYEVFSRFKDKKPRSTRVVFENLGEDEQFERTFFNQDKDFVDAMISARRSRNPKHIDQTVLPRV